MTRQCEFKTMYDPDLDMYVTKHIFDEDIPNIFDEGMTVGGGMTDIFKAAGKKLFGKTAKSAATTVATTTGEYVGNKGGYKIYELLRKRKTKTPSIQMEPNISPSESKVLTTQEINDRVNQILSGGKLRRSNFI